MNVQKGSGTIWTFDDELARLPNVQIVPDPFWTFEVSSFGTSRVPTASRHGRAPSLGSDAQRLHGKGGVVRVQL